MLRSLGRKTRLQVFNTDVSTRDGPSCRKCGAAPPLFIHQITSTQLMPHGGLVPENGITLCRGCLGKAELLNSIGTAALDYMPVALYRLIGGSKGAAVLADIAMAPME